MLIDIRTKFMTILPQSDVIRFYFEKTRGFYLFIANCSSINSLSNKLIVSPHGECFPCPPSGWRTDHHAFELHRGWIRKIFSEEIHIRWNICKSREESSCICKSSTLSLKEKKWHDDMRKKKNAEAVGWRNVVIFT